MKILAIILLLSSLIFGFSDSQIKLANQLYGMGKTFRTVDGMTIENTLPALASRESSLDLFKVGDKYNKDGAPVPFELMSFGAFQFKVATAKEVIVTNKLKQYFWLLSNEKRLINKLITDPLFGGSLAGYHFVNNYNEALKRNMWNPYFRAISRHNGIWTNPNYYKEVMKNLHENRQIIGR